MPFLASGPILALRADQLLALSDRSQSYQPQPDRADQTRTPGSRGGLYGFEGGTGLIRSTRSFTPEEDRTMSKKALCIGINDYPGTDSDLSGCVNDANDWAAELASRGFAVDQAAGRAGHPRRHDPGHRRSDRRRAEGRHPGHHLFRPRHLGAGQLRRRARRPRRRPSAPTTSARVGPLLDDDIRTLFAPTRRRGAHPAHLRQLPLRLRDPRRRGRPRPRRAARPLHAAGGLDAGRTNCRRPRARPPPLVSGLQAQRRRPAAGRLPGHRILLGHQLPGPAQRRLHLLRPEDPARTQAGQLRRLVQRHPRPTCPAPGCPSRPRSWAARRRGASRCSSEAHATPDGPSRVPAPSPEAHPGARSARPHSEDSLDAAWHTRRGTQHDAHQTTCTRRLAAPRTADSRHHPFPPPGARQRPRGRRGRNRGRRRTRWCGSSWKTASCCGPGRRSDPRTGQPGC